MFKKNYNIILLVFLSIVLVFTGCSDSFVDGEDSNGSTDNIALLEKNIKDYQEIDQAYKLEFDFADQISDVEVVLKKNGEQVDGISKELAGSKLIIEDFPYQKASVYKLAITAKNDSGAVGNQIIRFLSQRDDYPTVESRNDTMMQTFYWEIGEEPYLSDHPDEADLWQLLEEQAEEISDLGITSLWLPPAAKGDGGVDDMGYALYDFWDLGEFDQRGDKATRHGSKTELDNALEAIADSGMEAYFDVVLNHRMGGSKESDVPLAENEYVEEKESGWKFIFKPSEYGLDDEEIESVYLAGEMQEPDQWDPTDDQYSLTEDGQVWIAEFSDVKTGQEFKWIVDGEWTPEGNNLVVDNSGTGDFYTDFTGLKGRAEYYEPADEWQWNWQAFNGTDYEVNDGLSETPYRFKEKDPGNVFRNDWYLMGNDVDYNNPDVANEAKAWGSWIVNQAGFAGFRLDAIKHVDLDFTRDWLNYVMENTDQQPYFVAEAWESDTTGLVDYLDAVGVEELNAFDFPLREEFAQMRDGSFDMSKFAEAGLVNQAGYEDRAVTFIDNHDTHRDGDDYGRAIDNRKYQAYSYILMRAEGLPKLYWRDYYIDGLEKGLTRLLKARKNFAYGEGIELEVADSQTYGYLRAGNDDKTGLVMLISQSEAGGIKEVAVEDAHPNTTYYDYTGNLSKRITTDNNGNADFAVEQSSERGWSVWVPLL